MKSTTAIGDQLRDYVIEILEASGRKVDREARFDSKKIDVLLVDEDDFARRSIAIECKNYDHNLGQSELAAIYTEYLSLIQHGQIDELWVIVRLDFSPEAKNWARNQLGLHVFTLPIFEDRQHGFRQYTRQVAGLFQEDGLNQYYVSKTASNGAPLLEFVMHWIESDSQQPLALLGGYGMGKTSFARYLTSHLGRLYLADTTARVPIYVRLSDIAKEQDLDGLVSKTLAERYRIKDYHFQKFLNLNRAGKFVLIFDGSTK